MLILAAVPGTLGLNNGAIIVAVTILSCLALAEAVLSGILQVLSLALQSRWGRQEHLSSASQDGLQF